MKHFKFARLGILIFVAMLCITSAVAQQTFPTQIYIPIPGELAIFHDFPYNDNLSILSTMDGSVIQHISGVAGTHPHWNSEGKLITYSKGFSKVAIYNPVNNALDVQLIETFPLETILDPVGWSYNSSNILYQTVNVSNVSHFTISLFDIDSNSITMLRSYTEDQPITDIPPPPDVPSEVVLGDIDVYRNPIFDEWIAVRVVLKHHTTIDGLPVDVDYYGYALWNFVTNETIAINTLIPDSKASIAKFQWSPDGRFLIYTTENITDLERTYHLIQFSPDGNVLVLKAASTRHSITGWLGVRDMLLTIPPDNDGFYNDTDPIQFHIGQIINGVLHDRSFIDLPGNIVPGDTDFYLRASEAERHELSCLFDLALPQRVSQGVQTTNLITQSLRSQPDPEAAAVTTLNVADTITITGYRACTDNVRWWQITTSSGAVGWAMEADNTQYYLQPVGFENCNYISVNSADLISNITQANTASTPQTICLNANATYTFSQSSTWFFGDTALPPITGNITLKGNGATLERAATAPDFRLFGVDGTGTLTLENLTLRGGSLTENAGGAIVNVGGTVNLNNVTLENHQALSTSEGSGGAIYNYFGTLTMTNSQLLNNTAAVGAGGIYNWGGSVTVSNTCIVGNSAPDGLAITQFDTATTTAADNWWGAADGPGGAGSGSGDGVGANIAYTPFLTSEAAPCAPDVPPVPTETPTLIPTVTNTPTSK
jgi:hypothetical protein